MKVNDFKEVSERIKNSDYHQYLLCIHANKNKLYDLFIILLFNIEIASIAKKVSEPMIGLIRQQWWREKIEELFSKRITNHKDPLLDKIAFLINRYQLNKQYFEDLIIGREIDLYNDYFTDFGEFIEYAKKTQGSLTKLLVQIILETEINETLIEDIDNISVAWALCGYLTNSKKWINEDRFNLDNRLRGLLIKSIENDFDDINILRLEVDKYINICFSHLESVKTNFKSMPTLLQLQIVIIKHYLDKISNNSAAIMSYDYRKSMLLLHIKLLLNSKFSI